MIENDTGEIIAVGPGRRYHSDSVKIDYSTEPNQPGSSMKPLLNDGDIVLTVKENKFKTGDIVAFYHGNKILIKRVIGVESDFVNIDKDGIVYVNGKELKENYVKELKKGDSDIKYPVQVSDGSIFVLSDERDVLTDSRTLNVGQIKTNDIIGKVIFKVWPLKEIKKI